MDWGVFFGILLGLGGVMAYFFAMIGLGIRVANRLFGSLALHPIWFMAAWYFLFLVIPAAAVFAYFK